MLKKNWTHVWRIFLILLGTCIFAFGLVNFNIPNHLAEGGITGIALIFKNIWKIDPSYTTFLLNVPLIILGWKLLGKRSVLYTFIGTLGLSGWLWIWQRIPFNINIDHDLLIAAILAGCATGLGSGLVYRGGGTTGGADIIARILEKNFGITMGKSLLALDIIVLVMSLVYVDLKHMMYTLIASFIFSNLADFVQDGSYKGKGVIIVTDKSEEISQKIIYELDRGVTFLNGRGGYSKKEKDLIYCVLNPSEILRLKEIVEAEDPQAFLSILNVHDTIGEGFSYDRPSKFHPRK